MKFDAVVAGAVGLFLFAMPSFAATEPFEALAALDGRWTTVGDQKKFGADACKSHWTDYKVDADKRGVVLKTFDGKVLNYLVLYTEGDNAAMYIEGEDRRLSTGDRVVWVLMRESPDKFSWRAHGRPSTPAFADHASVRCK